MTISTRSGPSTGNPDPLPLPGDAAGGDPHPLDQYPVLATLEWQIAALADGRGGVTVVRGPAASGRTAILAEAARQATQQGIAVLTSPPAGSPPSATAHPLKPTTNRWPASALEPLLATATNILRHGAVVVVIVDDADRYDRPAALLRRLAEIAAQQPALFLLAWCDAHGADLRAPAGVRQLTPRPLSATAVDVLVTAHADRDTATALNLYDAVGGNPGLVLAALADHRDGGHPRWAGPALRRAVARLLGPPDGVELHQVATALAILDDVTEPAVLARVLNLPAAHIGDLADALAVADLTGPDGRLRPGAAQAVAHSTDPDIRHRLHVRAADVLHEDGAPIRQVARHLIEVAEAPQPWAHDVLCDAARQAAADGDLVEAVRLLELALSWCTEPGPRMDLRVQLLDLRWRMGQPADDLLDGLSSAARQPAADQSRWVSLPRHLAWHDRADEALELLGRAPADLNTDASIEHTIGALWVRHVYPGEHPTDGHHDPGPEPVLAHYPWLRRAGALVRLLADDDPDAAVDAAVDVISRIQPHQNHAEPLQMALFTLMSREQSAHCPAWGAEIMQKLQIEGQPVWRSMFHGAHAVQALWRGDPADAVTLADRALSQVGPQWTVLTAIPHAVRLMALTAQGHHGEVAAALCVPAPDNLIRSPYGLLHLRARGRHHLAVGALIPAIEDFSDIGRVMATWGLESPGLLPWRLDLAEASLMNGDLPAAQRLVEQHLNLTGRALSWSRARALRLLAQTLPPQRREQPLTRALDELAAHGPSVEQIRTLVALAETHRSLGTLPASRELHRLAERAARVLGTDVAHQALGTDTASGARTDLDRDPGVLTQAESRVAELAARGYRNREIGAALFITPSTVEQHLTRIFRKLGIEGREELGARLHDPQ